MPMTKWVPPSRAEPSPRRRGEPSPDAIYLAVGRALSRWEHAESAFIKLFQVLCETPSRAVCRAYGSIVSAAGRHEALMNASAEFFARRNLEVPDDLKELLAAFSEAGASRNKIAHGMAVGMSGRTGDEHLGYFLSPPSYATRHRQASRPGERWWLGAKYFYIVDDIMVCQLRFEELLKEAMQMFMSLNTRYNVIPFGEAHP